MKNSRRYHETVNAKRRELNIIDNLDLTSDGTNYAQEGRINKRTKTSQISMDRLHLKRKQG